MDANFLYNSAVIADNIKSLAKERQKSARNMLSEIGLGPNTISHMRQGRMPLAENLAKIADYLDCSVDYLLGRTNDVEVANAIELAPEEYPVLIKYRGLNDDGQRMVDKLIDELYTKRNAPTTYSGERIEAILQGSNEMQQLTEVLKQLPNEKLLEVIRFVQFQKSLGGSTGE